MGYLVRVPGKPATVVSPARVHRADALPVDELQILALTVFRETVIHEESLCFFRKWRPRLAAFTAEVAVALPQEFHHHKPDIDERVSTFPPVIRSKAKEKRGVPRL